MFVISAFGATDYMFFYFETKKSAMNLKKARI